MTNLFTRELWGVCYRVSGCIPGRRGCCRLDGTGWKRIAIKTAELKKYDVVIWAHHGMFCSGEDFDLTFGLLHTVEKSAEILVEA